MSASDPCCDKHTLYAALVEIRRILSDPALSDSACIERICRVYESLPDMPEADCRTEKDASSQS